MIISESKYPYICRVFRNIFPGGIEKLLLHVRKKQSAENLVSGALLANDRLSESHEIIVGIDSKIFRRLHSSTLYEDFFYLLKVLSIADESLSYNFELYKEIILPRQFESNRPWCFANTEVVSETYFLEYYENLLENKGYRLALIRRINTLKEKKFKRKASITKKLKEWFIEEILIIRTFYFPKENPKRLIRHKGYRDHGSLRLCSNDHGIEPSTLTEKEYSKLLGDLDDLRAWNLRRYNPKRH